MLFTKEDVERYKKVVDYHTLEYQLKKKTLEELFEICEAVDEFQNSDIPLEDAQRNIMKECRDEINVILGIAAVHGIDLNELITGLTPKMIRECKRIDNAKRTGVYEK